MEREARANLSRGSFAAGGEQLTTRQIERAEEGEPGRQALARMTRRIGIVSRCLKGEAAVGTGEKRRAVRKERRDKVPPSSRSAAVSVRRCDVDVESRGAYCPAANVSRRCEERKFPFRGRRTRLGGCARSAMQAEEGSTR